jgi:hypothetical protein
MRMVFHLFLDDLRRWREEDLALVGLDASSPLETCIERALQFGSIVCRTNEMVWSGGKKDE